MSRMRVYLIFLGFLSFTLSFFMYAARVDAAFFSEGDRVLIMPFGNSSAMKNADRIVEQILFLELTANTEATILHPRQVTEFLKNKEEYARPLAEDLKALRVAGELNATWVICATVIDYNGYSPYSLGFQIQIIRVSDADLIVSHTIYYSGSEKFGDNKLIEKVKRQFRMDQQLPTMEGYIHKVCNKLVIEGFN